MNPVGQIEEQKKPLKDIVLSNELKKWIFKKYEKANETKNDKLELDATDFVHIALDMDTKVKAVIESLRRWDHVEDLSILDLIKHADSHESIFPQNNSSQ
jgi:hypothetical protein